MKILVGLPANRWNLGQWSVLDDDDVTMMGPWAADGKSDSMAAAHHNNPERYPTRAYGDTPTGQFVGTLGSEPDTPDNRWSFGLPDETGNIPVIRLKPIEGDSDAWKRQTSEGRLVDMGLLIHSGPPNGASQLRPTHGCCRVWQKDLSQVVPLIKALGEGATFPVSIETKS